jgi:hypothetical protein
MNSGACEAGCVIGLGLAPFCWDWEWVEEVRGREQGSGGRAGRGSSRLEGGQRRSGSVVGGVPLLLRPRKRARRLPSPS